LPFWRDSHILYPEDPLKLARFRTGVEVTSADTDTEREKDMQLARDRSQRQWRESHT